MKWESKTVAELRAAAKKAGIKGYSRLNKDQLVHEITHMRTRSAGARPAATPRRRRAHAQPTTSTKPAATASASSRAPAANDPPATPAQWEAVRDDEMQIEDVKFRMTPPGTTLQQPAFTLPGEEDIDALPTLDVPLLALLPQKPGVLHVYWVLPATLWRPELHLRLVLVAHDHMQILHDFTLPASRGHWYLHVDASLRFDDLYVELGRYDARGQFIAHGPRSRTGLPSLYAASDSERYARFREMYLRAGGIERDGRLLWPGSVSSFSSRR